MATKKQSKEVSQLHRIIGQLQGVERMLEKKDCATCDCLQQIEAARGSLKSLEKHLLAKKTKTVKDSDFKKSLDFLMKIS